MTTTIPINLPNLLSGLRLALAPVLLILAFLGEATLFLPVLVFSLATDVADGFLARLLGQCSEFGTRLDSRADLATYLSLPLCAFWLRPEFVLSQLPLIGLLLASLVVPLGLGWLKFGALPSYHTWGAKLSAVCIGAALIALFAGGPVWPFRVVAAIVVLASLEEIAITAVLPKLESNVPSLFHALRGLR